MTATLDQIEAAALARMAGTARRPFVIGIAGAQGSGKSTLAAGLAGRLRVQGLRVAVLSLDDLYLPGSVRAQLAASVHPLLRTRGVPGTHDVAAGLALIDALARPGPVPLPRFDKATDEPGAPERFDAPADVLVLEGWCLGALPQDDAALVDPANDLERVHDSDGRWRRWVNDSLAGDYRALFDRIDQLTFLAAPGFGVVARWRIEQERSAGGPMSDDQVRAFVAHYQRITQAMLDTLPARADLTLRLDAERRVIGGSARPSVRR